MIIKFLIFYYYLLLSIQLISRSMPLQKITCIYLLSSCDKLSFPLLDLQIPQLPMSSYVSQIIKELCLSSSCSFEFCHLSSIEKAISSQNMTNAIAFLSMILFRCVLFSPISQLISILKPRHSPSLGLRMREQAFRCGGDLQIYLISNHGQPNRSDPPDQV